MKPDEIDLSETGNTYLIANTPLFLANRLQADSSVEALSRFCSSEDLYAGVLQALEKIPESPVDAVRPFAYLIALRRKDSPEIFSKAAALSSVHHPWYKTVARALEATFIPHVNESIWVGAPRPTIIQYPQTTVSTVTVEAEKV
jgi:hypothetical protein